MYNYLLSTVGVPHIVSSFDDLTNFDANIVRLRFEHKSHISVMRGTRMRSFKAMHNEIAASLQFTWYYGKNNNALWDCINDLAWLDSSSFVIAITNSECVLEDGTSDERVLLGALLLDACKMWSVPSDLNQWWGRQGVPFHIIMHFGDKNAIHNFGNIFDDIE